MSVHYDLVVRYYNDRQYDKAYVLARTLILENPFSAQHFKILGSIQQAKEEFSYAIGAYQRAFMMDCTDAQTAFCLAQCYTQLGEFDKALQWAHTSLLLKPDDQTRKLAAAVRKKIM
jgi:Flp pilus assembly protein TadD